MSQVIASKDEIQAYTIQLHGGKLARTHLWDWVILLLLLSIDVVLNKVVNPFARFVGTEMMYDLKYPFTPNTIPFWSVHVYAELLPIIFFIIRYLKRKDVHDLHHATLGLLYSVLITSLITDAIKVAVGRPRPNFFWRCFPDGTDFYDQLGNVICNGDPKDISEGYKSFPSGHTSLSFAGLGFLALYLSGKVQAFDGRGHISKLCVVFMPLLAAALVGVSRVDDYWHHWTDVFAGALIGLMVSFLCYLQFFPAPHRTKGWGPYSYFKKIETELQTNSDGEIQANQVITSPHFTPTRSRQDHSITID